jgi:class 3 adenylate cyclase/predicted ATPase
MTSSTNISPFDRIRKYLPANLADEISDSMPEDDALVICGQLSSLRKVLSTYLPRYLVSQIGEDPRPDLLRASFKEGAALFADVSGFTAMSEKLSVLGKEGAEEITSIVNDYFETMLEISDRYGGDLLKFGGDALLIFFEGPEGPARAVTVATAMQDSMSKYQEVKTSQGIFPLRMSIGIGSGQIFLTNLGSSEEMNYAVMGNALANMGRAEDLATAGEIIVDRMTRDATMDIASFAPKGENLWHFLSISSSITPEWKSEKTQEPTAALLDADVGDILLVCFSNLSFIEGLSPYVPDELLRRLIPNPSSPILYGSHRPVTVMFANFIGIDEIIAALGEEHLDQICDIMNTYFVKMSAIIAQYGGTISRVDSYVVGQRILAQFGALRAHEDDPQRAIRAGLEMNNALEQVNRQVVEILDSIPNLDLVYGDTPIKQRIGINSGFVFAGNMGSLERREYTVMGDQVNLTARLMSVSEEGDVLIGQSTARHVENDFQLDERPAVKVKGKTEPVRNFVVQDLMEKAPKEFGTTQSPIIGREKELSEARRAIADATESDGRLLAISGPSGIGKTRLVEEIITLGTSAGMDLLVGTCLSYGDTLTYHPWAEILRSIFGLQSSDEPHQRIKTLEQRMEDLGESDWTPVIGTVMGLEVPDNDLTRDLDAKLRRQRVLDIIVKLLQVRAQKKPLMLIVEDAHWADSASMDLINYVNRNIADQPILFILPHRPDDGLPDWTEPSHAVGIDLLDLDEDAVMEIVESMFGPISIPESIRTLILSRASGNPFFVGEVVRALRDADIFQQDPSGNWEYVDTDVVIELPDTIHGVVISRIDRLDETDRGILQTAAVVGRMFDYETLSGVFGASTGSNGVKSRLDSMQNLGLVEALDREKYRFIHLTTREVVYESLSYGLRRELHYQIGDFIEETHATTLNEQIDLLAYHYYQGQSWEKALGYNLTAGERAQTEFANDIAIMSYEHVLEAAENLSEERDTASEQVGAYESLGEVLTLVGRYEEALENYASARDIVEIEVEQTPRLADLYRKTAEVYERQSEYETAHEWLVNGLNYLDADHASPEIVDIYILRAGIYQRQGQIEEAASWAQQSLSLAKRIPTREGKKAAAHSLYVLGGIYYRYGDLDRAVEFCQQSINAYEEIEDVVGQARANNNLGSTYSMKGDWDLAREALHKSLDINRRIGEIQGQGAATNNLGNIYLNQGNWEMAAEHFRESNSVWKKIGAVLPEAITLSNLAQAYIYQGQIENTRETLDQAQAIFQSVASDDFIPELDRRWAEYFMMAGDSDQALEFIQRSIDLATQQEARLELGLSLRILGEIQMQRNELEDAEITANQSLEILEELNSDYEAAKSVVTLAAIAISRETTFDRPALARALDTFQKLGAKADAEEASKLLKKASKLD